MAISLVTLLDTFLSWMNKTNEVITISNLATEGQLNTSGTITITNASLLAGGVSLNVANGMIKGDGGLISNISATISDSSITNAKLANNNIQFVSNSSTLTLTTSGPGANANLGSTLYFDIGSLSVRANDTSVSNIASANVVNVVHDLAIAAFTAANSGTSAAAAYDKANAANVLAAQAYDAANNSTGGGYFKGTRGTVGNANNLGDIFRVNFGFLGANVEITESERAVAVGPLAVNSGFSLVISGNGRAVIV